MIFLTKTHTHTYIYILFYFLWKRSMNERAIVNTNIYNPSRKTTTSHSKNEQCISKGNSKINLGYRMKCTRFSIKTEMSLSQKTCYVCQRICLPFKSLRMWKESTFLKSFIEFWILCIIKFRAELLKRPSKFGFLIKSSDSPKTWIDLNPASFSNWHALRRL